MVDMVMHARCCVQLKLILFYSATALFNISFSHETANAPSRALQCSREALCIRRTTLPAGHKHVADAEMRVRRLEQALRQAGAVVSVEAAAARNGCDA